MAPKRRAAPTPQFSIVDLLATPLSGLGNAIAALRSRPTPLSPREAAGVARQAANILDLAEQSIRADLGAAVVPQAAALLLDGLAHSRAAEEEGLRRISHADTALFALDAMFRFAVEKRSVPVEAQIDVMEVLHYVCDLPETKDAAGETFMQRIATLLAKSPLHFALHRSLCTALINLIKCSKANKLRLKTYAPVCTALVRTTDYFLQLQCVEVLYRVSRQNPQLLEAVKDNLPAMLFDGIRVLPNTDQLFARIAELADTFNASRDTRTIVGLPVLHVRAGTEDLFEGASTRVYFAPDFFMVLRPNSAADNIAIEYTCIRSLRTKGGTQLSVRLKEPPESIAAYMTVGEEGKDALAITFEAEAFAEFRASHVQKWIGEILRKVSSAYKRPAAAVAPALANQALLAHRSDAAPSPDLRQPVAEEGKRGAHEEVPRLAGHSSGGRRSHNTMVAVTTSVVLAAEMEDEAKRTREQHLVLGTPGVANAAGGVSGDGVSPAIMATGQRTARPLDMSTPAHPEPPVPTGAVRPRPAAPTAILAQDDDDDDDIVAADDAPPPPTEGIGFEEDPSPLKAHRAEQAPPAVVFSRAASAAGKNLPALEPNGTTAAAAARSRAPSLDFRQSVPPVTSSSTEEQKPDALGTSVRDAGNSGVLGPHENAAPAANSRQGTTVSRPPELNLPNPFGSPEGQGYLLPVGGHEHVSPPKAATVGGGGSDFSGLAAALHQSPSAPENRVTAASSALENHNNNHNANDPTSMEEIMAEIQRKMAERIAELKREAVATVQECFANVQLQVDDARAITQKDREAFRGFVGGKLDELRRQADAANEAREASVVAVAAELDALKGNRAETAELLRGLHDEFHAVPTRNRSRESEHLRLVKQHFDSELSKLQRAANDVVRTSSTRGLAHPPHHNQSPQQQQQQEQQQPTTGATTDQRLMAVQGAADRVAPSSSGQRHWPQLVF